MQYLFLPWPSLIDEPWSWHQQNGDHWPISKITHKRTNISAMVCNRSRLENLPRQYRVTIVLIFYALILVSGHTYWKMSMTLKVFITSEWCLLTLRTNSKFNKNYVGSFSAPLKCSGLLLKSSKYRWDLTGGSMLILWGNETIFILAMSLNFKFISRGYPHCYRTTESEPTSVL